MLQSLEIHFILYIIDNGCFHKITQNKFLLRFVNTAVVLHFSLNPSNFQNCMNLYYQFCNIVDVVYWFMAMSLSDYHLVLPTELSSRWFLIILMSSFAKYLTHQNHGWFTFDLLNILTVEMRWQLFFMYCLHNDNKNVDILLYVNLLQTQ